MTTLETKVTAKQVAENSGLGLGEFGCQCLAALSVVPAAIMSLSALDAFNAGDYAIGGGMVGLTSMIVGLFCSPLVKYYSYYYKAIHKDSNQA
jgi:hypothetical protein